MVSDAWPNVLPRNVFGPCSADAGHRKLTDFWNLHSRGMFLWKSEDVAKDRDNRAFRESLLFLEWRSSISGRWYSFLPMDFFRAISVRRFRIFNV